MRDMKGGGIVDENKNIAPFSARPKRPANKGYGDAGASYVKKALKGLSLIHI